jgi:hypothetical protein
MGGRGHCFVFSGIETHSGYEFACLAPNVSASIIFLDLINTLFITMIFYMTLFLTKESIHSK